MHACFDQLSDESIRTAAQFESLVVCPSEWRNKIVTVLEHKIHPVALARCGTTAALLAFCGITLERLIEGRQGYMLEHLIQALNLSFEDLQLLGFRVGMLAKPQHYPLIVLYDLCKFRAETLFALEIGYTDLQRFVLDVNPLYEKLLNLNLPWWRGALQHNNTQ